MLFDQVSQNFKEIMSFISKYYPVISVVQNPRERNDLRKVLDSIDIESQENGRTDETDDIVTLAMNAYNTYKIKYKKNIGFDPQAWELCK